MRDSKLAMRCARDSKLVAQAVDLATRVAETAQTETDLTARKCKR